MDGTVLVGKRISAKRANARGNWRRVKRTRKKESSLGGVGTSGGFCEVLSSRLCKSKELIGGSEGSEEEQGRGGGVSSLSEGGGRPRERGKKKNTGKGDSGAKEEHRGSSEPPLGRKGKIHRGGVVKVADTKVCFKRDCLRDGGGGSKKCKAESERRRPGGKTKRTHVWGGEREVGKVTAEIKVIRGGREKEGGSGES